jgi:hypothetical protein
LQTGSISCCINEMPVSTPMIKCKVVFVLN